MGASSVQTLPAGLISDAELVSSSLAALHMGHTGYPARRHLSAAAAPYPLDDSWQAAASITVTVADQRPPTADMRLDVPTWVSEELVWGGMLHP